jgi:hypothetical protein
MAIISCPDCEKNISSHSAVCPYCGFERDEEAEDKLREFRRRKLRDHIYRLKMSSYLALTLLIVSFGWYLMETSGFKYKSSVAPYVLFTIGAVSYLVIRIYLYKFKAALRKLNF